MILPRKQARHLSCQPVFRDRLFLEDVNPPLIPVSHVVIYDLRIIFVCVELDYLSSLLDTKWGIFTGGCGHVMHYVCWHK